MKYYFLKEQILCYMLGFTKFINMVDLFLIIIWY